MQQDILNIDKDLMNLFLMGPKVLLTSYKLNSVSHLNTHNV